MGDPVQTMTHPTALPDVSDAPVAGIALRPMQAHHLKEAQALSRAVGWPHRSQDWAMMLPLSCGHVAVASEGGKPRLVGTALRSQFGPTLASISMVIVAQEWRGRGLGRALVTAALPRDTVAVRLVATPSGRPLYASMGFQDRARVAQHQGLVTQADDPDRSAGADGAGTVRWAEGRDLDRIQALENRSHGGDRTALMTWLAAQGRLAVLGQGGQVAGFAGGRRFGHGWVIGPVVAPTPEAAQQLIALHLRDLPGQFVRLDILDSSGLGPWLTQKGLANVDQPLLMQRGSLPFSPQRMALFSQGLG